MSRLVKGDFVEFDGQVAVVVGTDDEKDVPEEHVLLWYGEPGQARKSESSNTHKRVRPIVFLVPEEYCTESLTAKIKH